MWFICMFDWFSRVDLENYSNLRPLFLDQAALMGGRVSLCYSPGHISESLK
jgi:hypothetical protein